LIFLTKEDVTRANTRKGKVERPNEDDVKIKFNGFEKKIKAMHELKL